MKMAAGELEREARRVLRRLSAPRTVLAALNGGEDFGIFTVRNKWSRAVLRTTKAHVEGFHAQEWIEPAGEGDHVSLAGAAPRYVLSAIGEAFLTRAAGGDAPHAAQHRLMESRPLDPTQPRGRRVMANAAESPLGWLRHRRGADGQALISEAEFQAGERLRADFTKAGLTARITADWSLAPGTAPKGGGARAGQLEITDMRLAARQRFARAMDAVGAGLSDVLISVCCHLQGLEDAERGLGWPQRSGKVVLKIALGRLAEHYGLVPKEGRTGRLRHWRKD